MKLLKVIRQFEMNYFQGVPEKPELSFERDNFTNVTERSTGSPISTDSAVCECSNSTLVGYIIDDFEKDIEIFKPISN